MPSAVAEGPAKPKGPMRTGQKPAEEPLPTEDAMSSKKPKPTGEAKPAGEAAKEESGAEKRLADEDKHARVAPEVDTMAEV